MARQRSEQLRIFGPYRHRRQFRIVIRQGGAETSRLFETEAEARSVIRALHRAAKSDANKTLDEAIELYEEHLRHEKGNKRVSVDATVDRMRAFFPDVELVVSAITAARAAAIYTAYRTKLGARTGRPPAADTHRNVLSEARTFMAWCVKMKFVASNAFTGVEGVGRRRHGKPQLRVDESRRWLRVAVAEAEQGKPGAVAAMFTLLLGMRASEVVSRVARDVDDDGKLLWIPDSKTAAGKRTLEIPEMLRPHVLRLTTNLEPDAPLFGQHWRDWVRKEVARICVAAKTPVVSAHGMRGLHSTLAVRAGITGHVVAQALGHESFSTTLQSYATPSSFAAAKQDAVLDVLEGGGSRARAGNGLAA